MIIEYYNEQYCNYKHFDVHNNQFIKTVTPKIREGHKTVKSQWDLERLSKSGLRGDEKIQIQNILNKWNPKFFVLILNFNFFLSDGQQVESESQNLYSSSTFIIVEGKQNRPLHSFFRVELGRVPIHWSGLLVVVGLRIDSHFNF